MGFLEDISIPIVGTPLLIDSLDKNGTIPVALAAAAGQPPAALLNVARAAPGYVSPVNFALRETIKWRFYRAAKSSIGKIKMFGFDFSG